MRKTTLSLLAIAGLSLTACSTGGLFDRSRPDEFAVQRQAPLVVPPDFSLVPPSPGAPRPADESASQDALEAIFGGPAQRSAVESNVVGRAGAADPGIRSEVGDPKTNTVSKGSVTRDIIAAPQGDGASAQAVIPAG